MSTNVEKRGEFQLFVDMDGVLVDFEGGVLKYMNERFQELKDLPDHPDYKLARSTAKESVDGMLRSTNGTLPDLIWKAA